MPRRQHKTTMNNSKYTMSPPQPSNAITAGYQYCDIGKEQDRNLKIVFMTMKEVLKEEIN